MEMKKAIHHLNKRLHLSMCVIFVVLLLSIAKIAAQPPLKSYTVKNGRMLIELSKLLKESSLDSFISQYDLYDLNLKECLLSKSLDTLGKLGWRLERNDQLIFSISKPLVGVDNIANPANKILFTEKHPTISEMFPAVSNQVMYGYNNFRNKKTFAVKNKSITFYLRNTVNAKEVILSGSFNNWSPYALPMTKTDSGWITTIQLAPGKYWYKFIVDGQWTTDKDNQLSENDGLGNVNSVVYKTNIVFKLDTFLSAKRVYLSGSFNGWKPRELQLQRTAQGWELPLYLADGTHTYRFVVDERWYVDPSNRDRLPNEYDDFNSVVRIGKPYVFKLDGYKAAKQVVLSGSFNGWRKNELYMNRTATGWELPYTIGPGNYEYNFIIDGKWVAKASDASNNSNLFFIIEPNYTFRLKGFPDAKRIFLAGDFNNWSPNAFPMKRIGNEWVLAAHLPIGKHLYKFVVDGKWIIDPGNKLWEQNEHATGNSVIWIDKTASPQ